MEVCDAFAYRVWCSKGSDYCILGLHCQTENIMATIDITQKTGPASGEEAAVIAIPPAWSQASSATMWWGGHRRRIALVGGAIEGVLTLSTHWERCHGLVGPDLCKTKAALDISRVVLSQRTTWESFSCDSLKHLTRLPPKQLPPKHQNAANLKKRNQGTCTLERRNKIRNYLRNSMKKELSREKRNSSVNREKRNKRRNKIRNSPKTRLERAQQWRALAFCLLLDGNASKQTIAAAAAAAAAHYLSISRHV
jgi:hypothetical protein